MGLASPSCRFPRALGISAILILAMAAVCNGAPTDYLVMHRYLDSSCQQPIGFDQLYYWGECWIDTADPSGPALAAARTVWWRDHDGASVTQCHNRPKNLSGLHSCQGSWDFTTGPTCEKIPLDTCVPNWMPDDTWGGLSPARATHIKWRIVRLDPIVATHYTVTSYNGPNGDTCDARNYRKYDSAGKLEGQQIWNQTPKLAAPRLFFNYTNNKCVDQPCFAPNGTAYPACNWRKASFSGSLIRYCTAPPYQTYQGCEAAPEFCEPQPLAATLNDPTGCQSYSTQSHVGGLTGYRFWGVVSSNPFDTRDVGVTPSPSTPTVSPGTTQTPPPSTSASASLYLSSASLAFFWLASLQ